MSMPVALPPVVARIASEYRRTKRGTVTCLYRRSFSVHAGPSDQTQDFTFDGTYVDGRLVSVRILRYTVNGKRASAAQIRSIVHSYEHPKRGDVFEAPWDPRFMHQYRDVVRGRTLFFTALNRTYGHGNGSFTYDAHDDVVSYTYTPAVMPQHATSGTVTGRRARVLPGYWAMVGERQTYSGHYAVFGASASVVIMRSGFHRVR